MVGAGLGIDFQNFHRILPSFPGAGLGADGGFPGVDFFIGRNRQSRALPAPAGDAEHPLGGIAQQRREGHCRFRHALELARVPGFSLLHLRHGGIEGISPGHGQQAAAVADTVAQCAEHTGFRVIEGHRADTSDALPQKYPHSRSFPGGRGGQLQLVRLSAPADGEGQRFPALLQCPPDILGTGNGFAVDFQNLVTDFQPGTAGGAAQNIVISRHGDFIII